jgi:vancomycin permeability regulator SanA
LTRPVPRSPVSGKRARRKSLDWKPRLALAALALVAGLLAWAIIARQLAPSSNTALTRFDAIIVLGTPADSDGNPRPNMLSRVTEAVREYKRGVAPRLILTGGPTHNNFVEARVMARTAQAQGIPESAIVMEPQAIDTIENACYSVRIMRAHGWRSAEVIAGAYHLPRAGLIFNSIASPSLEWRGHAAPPLAPQSAAYENALAAVEVLKTARYLIWGRWVESCEP